jgi:hypothetical protein
MAGIVEAARKPGPGRLRGALLALAVAVGLVAAGVWFLTGGGGLVPSRASIEGQVVRAPTADGADRVFVMTSQWRSFRARGSFAGTAYGGLIVDVWAFDPATGRPVWRQRLVDDRRAVNMGRRLLGAHGGILWLFDGKSLLGLSPKDGARVADNGTFAAANPMLRGVMPTEERYIRFDPQGLSFTAADGRDWRLTGQGSATRRDGARLDTDAERAAPQPGVYLAARNAGGVGSWMFYAGGLELGDGRWLGLMADAEAANLGSEGAVGGVDPQTYPRTRLYSATVVRGSMSSMYRPVATNAKPLPESPEFLTAGLLQDGRCCHGRPILLNNPDSVLVIHRDRLGDQSRLRLTRVAGPLGKPLWTADLPLEKLEAVLPGERTLVLVGRRDEPPLFRTRDNRPESVDQLVSVDVATGRLATYGFRIVATAPHDLPESSTPSP